MRATGCEGNGRESSVNTVRFDVGSDRVPLRRCDGNSAPTIKRTKAPRHMAKTEEER